MFKIKSNDKNNRKGTKYIYIYISRYSFLHNI